MQTLYALKKNIGLVILFQSDYILSLLTLSNHWSKNICNNWVLKTVLNTEVSSLNCSFLLSTSKMSDA